MNEERKTVLIIDDDSTNRMVLKYPLQNRPELEILEASDGLQGLSIARTKHIDLILLDIHMPKMDGIEFLKVRLEDEQLREIPVVVISTDDEHKKEAIAYGANDYLVKPISPSKIYEIISPYLV